MFDCCHIILIKTVDEGRLFALTKNKTRTKALLYALISLCPLFFMSMSISVLRYVFRAGKEEEYCSCLDLSTAVGSALLFLIGIVGVVWYKKRADSRQYVLYRVEVADESNEQALTFYLSVILPVISNAAVDGLVGFVCFWMIVLMTIALLIRTKACYANPVLVMLGLNLFRVTVHGKGGAIGQMSTDSSSQTIWVLANEKNINKGSLIKIRQLSDSYYYARIYKDENILNKNLKE